jgi:hypothetical protein
VQSVGAGELFRPATRTLPPRVLISDHCGASEEVPFEKRASRSGQLIAEFLPKLPGRADLLRALGRLRLEDPRP